MSAAGIPEYIRERLKSEIEKENPQLWMACCFVYYTAIRPGTELRFMKIKQINFSSRTITVCNELSKNKRTETIDIPDELYRLITEEWQLQKYDRELYILVPYL
jgi:integrase